MLPVSFGNVYISLAVNYVSTWVDVIPTRTNEASIAIKFLRRTYFLGMAWLVRSLVTRVYILTTDPLTHYLDSTLLFIGYPLLVTLILVDKLRCPTDR